MLRLIVEYSSANSLGYIKSKFLYFLLQEIIDSVGEDIKDSDDEDNLDFEEVQETGNNSLFILVFFKSFKNQYFLIAVYS